MTSGSADRTIMDAIRADRSRLIQALREVDPSVNGKASIRCPFHDDKHPSASIHEDEDGVWRLHCFGCSFKGDVFDVLQKIRGLSFKGALDALGLPAVKQAKLSLPGKADERLPSTDQPGTDVAKLVAESSARLQADGDALNHLWRTRAIDQDSAKRFGLGITDDGRYWTLPITDASGSVVAVKHHRAMPDVEPKCFWTPKGTNAKRAWPASLDGAGPIWVCPGELKALAVISVGLPAVGITCGESDELPEALVGVLEGHPVALLGDDDKTGAKWVQESQGKLAGAGIDVRAVDSGFDTEVGVNDITDYLVRERVGRGRNRDHVAADLRKAYAAADPLASFTLSEIWSAERTWEAVEYIETGLHTFDKLAGGGLRARAVHLFVGKPGKAKTQVVTQIAGNVAALGVPAAIISLELDRFEVAQLIMAQRGDILRRWLERGEVRGKAAERLQETRDVFRDAPLMVLDDEAWQGGLDRLGLKRLVADGVRRFGWRLVVLDYLGLLAAGESDRSDYQTDLLNSSSLRRIARMNNIALVVVAALRKAATYKKPTDQAVTLDDVAGAGRITYDAAFVWLVDNKQMKPHPGAQPNGIVHLVPIKTRFSGAASDGSEVQLRWRPECGAVENMESPLDDPSGEGGSPF